jgi:hypothetical protein
MKYIKKFETLYKNYTDINLYTLVNHGNDYNLFAKDLLEIIEVDVDYDDKNIDVDWICKYDIDVIKFLKEIFLEKEITFYAKNENWFNKVKIYDVNLFVYKDEVYITVKINEITEKNDWKIIQNSSIVTVYNYDALNKPEHQKLKQLKKAEKYNL